MRICLVHDLSPNGLSTGTRSLLIATRSRPRSWCRIPFLLMMACTPLLLNRPWVQRVSSGRPDILSNPGIKGVMIICCLFSCFIVHSMQSMRVLWSSIIDSIMAFIMVFVKVKRSVVESAGSTSFRIGTLWRSSRPREITCVLV